VRQYVAATAARIDAGQLDGVDHFEHRLDLRLAIGAQQDARAGQYASDALHVVERHRRLQHHELPERRAVVVADPFDAAADRARREHRDAPPAVQSDLAHGLAEAQVEVHAMLDEGERDLHVDRPRRQRRLRPVASMGKAAWGVFMPCPPQTPAPATRAAYRPP
jgi:hypothetical protein